MKTIIATILAGSFAVAFAGSALAQSAQIPTPVNPYPINPVATNGTPLPSQSNAVRSGGYAPGRPAAFDFVGNFAGAGLNGAGAVVGTGVGLADSAVGIR